MRDERKIKMTKRRVQRRENLSRQKGEDREERKKKNRIRQKEDYSKEKK